MLDFLFMGSVALYFVAVLLHFGGMVFKKEKITSVGFWVFTGGVLLLTIYLVARGYIAKRLPLSNQFEFASAFAWGAGLLLIILQRKFKVDWVSAAGMPLAFLILSYAALQPREITELMPALKSAWFGLHIGSAVFSYSCFALAGCAGLKYLLQLRKGVEPNVTQMLQIDYMSYRLISMGFLLLTVVILSGAIWAEQAWSSFWTWDPKEVWALITWILYAIYLHLRIRKKKSGKTMAWIAVIAVPVVMFTFIGVNTLLPGLHSYG